jgi:methyltransferase (TIGR00027 family)
MEDNCPSKTAIRVAARRAAHQVLDDPRIFDDPLALRILGLDKGLAAGHGQGWLDDAPLSRVLRASLAARSRYAEDALGHAREQGVAQYVILGAGLDTFAYRHPSADNGPQIFEVDHPAMQEWKRRRLQETAIAIPPHCTLAPVDFETQTLADGLRAAGFKADAPAFFSWLGVTMYLTIGAIDATLRFVASLPAGSGIVFDYMISPALLSPKARQAFDGLAQRVASAGEPFQTFFDPPALTNTLRDLGFGQIEDMAPEAIDARYFRGRTDGLRAGKLSHIMTAWVCETGFRSGPKGGMLV